MIDPKEDAQLRQMVADGLNTQQICERLYLTSGAVSYRLHRLGLKIQRSGRRLKLAEQERRMEAYHKHHMTDREAAAALGINQETWRQWRRREHLPANIKRRS